MKLGPIVSAVLALSTMPAAAQNLVANGGFETGDFTGWQQFGNIGGSGVTTDIQNAGIYAAFFGPVGSQGGIRQTLGTVAGQLYRLTFDLQNNSGDPFNRYGVFVDGFTQVVASNSPAFDYTTQTYEFTALDDRTTLVFRFQHDPSFFYLDNVAFYAVPEPASWALMISGFGLVGLGLRRRGRKRAAA